MKAILVTNNPAVMEKYKNREKIEMMYLEDAEILEVFIKVRDMVHNGAKLLTHPLTSSIKPDETPYKSIVVDNETCNNLDFSSLDIISNSIEVVEKFLFGKNKKVYTQDTKDDFQAIDLATIASGIESMELIGG